LELEEYSLFIYF